MLLLGEKLEGKFTIQHFGVAYLQKMAVCEQCVIQSRFFQVTQYKRMRFWWLNTRFESSNQWQSISEKSFFNKVSFWWLNAYNFFLLCTLWNSRIRWTPSSIRIILLSACSSAMKVETRLLPKCFGLCPIRLWPMSEESFID